MGVGGLGVPLLAFLGKSTDAHTVLGETVACASVSPHLYTLLKTYKCSVSRHSGSCTQTSGLMEFVTS